MPKLSEHFSNEDFKCKCDACRGEGFRVHLGLVGILEMLSEHFRKKVDVLSAFWCEKYFEALKKNYKTYHTMGKAVHIRIEGIPLAEIFKLAETIPEINGIGFYPKENFIHLDTRPKEKKDVWVKEGDLYSALTPEKRRQYGL